MSGQGGEVRRLDRAPGDRYTGVPGSGPSPAPAGSTRGRRIAAAVGAALGTAAVTFLLTTFDVGPGLLVVAAAGGWLTGLALSGGARAGQGPDAGPRRGVGAAALGAAGVALGLTADAVRALAQGGVLAPWDYALDRFGWLAPAFLVAAATAAAIRGR